MLAQQNKSAKNTIKEHPFFGKKHRLRLPLRFAGHLLLSCGIVWLLLGVMFLFAKGPAYIYFEESSTENGLSGLYSQSICLDADTVMADMGDGAYIHTQIRGTVLALSAPSLSDWMKTVMQKKVSQDAVLLLEGDRPWLLGIQHSSADGTARYRIQNACSMTVDPLASANISGTVEELQIFPWTSAGNAFESFVLLDKTITFTIPDDADVQVYIVYSDDDQNRLRVPVDRETLPEHQTRYADTWSFLLNDASVLIRSWEGEPLAFQTLGQYELKLSCVGVEQVQGYLTGTMLFQNTASQKSYTLAGQLVKMESSGHGLNMLLCRDLRPEPETDSVLSISGEATKMDISGVDPFPNLRMWFRENVYIAPVSLLSVVISTIGLTLAQKPRKVKVRRRYK